MSNVPNTAPVAERTMSSEVARGKTRVWHLAQQTGRTSRHVVARAADMGVRLHSPSSPVEPVLADLLRERLGGRHVAAPGAVPERDPHTRPLPRHRASVWMPSSGHPRGGFWSRVHVPAGR